MAGFSFEIGSGHIPLPLSCCTTLLEELLHTTGCPLPADQRSRISSINFSSKLFIEVYPTTKDKSARTTDQGVEVGSKELRPRLGPLETETESLPSRRPSRSPLSAVYSFKLKTRQFEFEFEPSEAQTFWFIDQSAV